MADINLIPEEVGKMLAEEWQYSKDSDDVGAMDAIVAVVNRLGKLLPEDWATKMAETFADNT